MATLSYVIGQDLQVIRKVYQEDGNFEACYVLNLAEDLVDGFSKSHGPASIYLNRLHNAFTENMERPDATANEKEAWIEVLEVISTYQEKLTD